MPFDDLAWEDLPQSLAEAIYEYYEESNPDALNAWVTDNATCKVHDYVKHILPCEEIAAVGSPFCTHHTDKVL